MRWAEIGQPLLAERSPKSLTARETRTAQVLHLMNWREDGRAVRSPLIKNAAACAY
jgi:hypothetical protein